MPARTLEAQIDRLYQLPLDEFTAARNALAKQAGTDAARVRALQKPSVAAWAVNQLYWQKRDVWDALIAAAESARRAHKAVLSGRSGDVRASSQVHEESVEAALKATLSLLQSSAHPVTDGTRQQIATTLRALPGSDEPGRLTHALQPGGFEMLAGVAVAGGAKRPTSAARPVRDETPPRSKQDARVLTRAREAAASAARALREAEQAVRREEFEIARTTREEKRASEAAEKAHEAVARAQAELKDAERERAASKNAREAAEKRAREAEHALGAARTRQEAAAAALQKLEED